MKKFEKYIYLVLGVIIIGVVIAGILFITTKDDEITLTNEEIEEYLSYVPDSITDTDQSVYYNPNNVEDMDEKLLLGATLNYIQNSKQEELEYYSKDEVENYYYKLYNKRLSDIQLDTENAATSFNCISYYYDNEGKFIPYGGCGIDYVTINSIESYKVTNDELIIYEYYTRIFQDLDSIGSNEDTVDFNDYSGWKTGVQISGTVQEYFENHKTEFTKYKHTFKKGNNGYYWYSTEVES